MMNIPKDKIVIKDIKKSFRVGFHKSDGFLAKALSFVLGKESKRIMPVLDSISLSVAQGENLGLIGNNGSGKSTLLRIIAGIYQADSGEVNNHGESIYMNGFGIGLKHRLSMKENIYLIATLMGLSRQQIKERFEDIVEFAELKDFVNTKIYQFSYGMISRLCFSTTIHCLEQKNPPIILLDEVFGSGGDLNFQNKAIAKIEEFIKGGAAVILVSHHLDIIEKYCDRVIWLKNGRIFKEGPAGEIVSAYIQENLA